MQAKNETTSINNIVLITLRITGRLNSFISSLNFNKLNGKFNPYQKMICRKHNKILFYVMIANTENSLF
ncbi:MAG TPA: hypothetical protein DFI01_00240, partial [Bacteroidales bacterium]|nr:hypothetical protein [Bacteroidales bacterium]